AAVTLQPLPGLQIFSGQVYGSRNRRTPELLADGRDEFTLFINLGGPYLISQGAREQLPDHGAATLGSTCAPCSLVHHPPGSPRPPWARWGRGQRISARGPTGLRPGRCGGSPRM